MPADGTLNLPYSTLRSLVQERRFPSATAIPYWLAAAYTDIWNSGDWTFAKTHGVTFWTTSDGTSVGTPTVTPEMPVAFDDVIVLNDDLGCPLYQVSQHTFEKEYTDQVGLTVTGRPDTFAVINRQIWLYPKPDRAYQFTLSHTMTEYVRDNLDVVKAGFFTVDTDWPAWNNHHYLIVLRARILGLRDRSDPTADNLVQEYQGLLESMRTAYDETPPAGEQMPAWRG